MAHYTVAKKVIQLKVAEATLLSEDELYACINYVTKPDAPDAPEAYWYLRTPYEDGMIGRVEPSYTGPVYAASVTPDDVEIALNGLSGTGLRPVLKLAADSEKPAPGDTVRIGAYTFVAIAEDMLLCDQFVWREQDSTSDDNDDDDFIDVIFNKNPPRVYNTLGCFDEGGSNDYEHSQAKERVDNWFKKEIAPEL